MISEAIAAKDDYLCGEIAGRIELQGVATVLQAAYVEALHYGFCLIFGWHFCALAVDPTG